MEHWIRVREIQPTDRRWYRCDEQLQLERPVIFSPDEYDVQENRATPDHGQFVQHDLGMPQEGAMEDEGSNADDRDERVCDHVSLSTRKTNCRENPPYAQYHEGYI